MIESSKFKFKEFGFPSEKESKLQEKTVSHFNPQNFRQGQEQVIGSCNGYSLDERWQQETPIFRDIILNNLPENTKTVLDYGCGVGRIAKEIINSTKDIQVIGVDASIEMLKLAKEYIASERFIPMLPREFNQDVDFAYCIYVLQHISDIYLFTAIDQLTSKSRNLLLANSVCRMAAIEGKGFVNDNVDILSEVSKHYSKIDWAIPAEIIRDNMLMRAMFMGRPVALDGGNTFHYCFLLSR